MKPFFITTAIDYVNSAPHIGHAYEKVLADVIARYHRLKGDEVFYLTGVDQHGQKVQQSIEKAGMAPQEYVDLTTSKFVAVWKKLDVEYDGWAATTDPSHKACVQTLLQRLYDEGQLYKAKHSGYYSVRQEQFLTEKERGPDGEFGAEWGEVVLIEEENYYFRLAEHRDWLLELIDARPDLVTPEFRRTELRNAVEKLVGDLCISRPKSRLSWGIELPFDPEYVTYVWFDALVNYISFAPGFDPASKIQNTEFHAWWPAVHVIGKDIMIPAHGVYWPIMLRAIGFADADIPTLLVHGWWNVAGAKMSKSTGNVVDPDALADTYGAEAVRYYLMADIVTGKDSDFSEERLVQRYNVDLANSIGNLLNRTLNMVQKYREGILKGPTGNADPNDDGAALSSARFVEAYQAACAEFKWDAAIGSILELARGCNEFIEAQKPWALAKDETKNDHLDAVLYALAESLRIIAIMLSPVLPKAARGIWEQLGVTGEFRLADAVWGKLKDGHHLGQPVPLFPRIENPQNSANPV